MATDTKKTAEPAADETPKPATTDREHYDLANFPDRLPAGTYNFVVASAEVGETNAGAPAIKMSAEVLDGEYETQVVYETLSFTGGGAQFTAEKLAAILGRRMTSDEDRQEICDALAERTFRALIEINEYQGKRNPRFRKIFGPARDEATGSATSAQRGPVNYG